MTEEIGYGQWGHDFFRTAVTEARLLAAVKQLAGRPIEFGPLGVGPGRLAQITATGEVGEPTCDSMEGKEVSFRLLIPAHVEFDLDLQVNKQHFSVELVIPIIATAKALPDLKIFIDTLPPGPKDLEVSVKAHGLRATLMSVAADVEGELRKFVAKFVAREIEKPEIAAARTIDVGGRIDGAWRA
ncbi:MAG TPA: hypothetical protein VN108_04245 [Marmoricola sp.]|nr:hypothetical protein [Marmoricola sp.]